MLTGGKTEDAKGRSLHGERGLKYSFSVLSSHCFYRRSLHGERGLKFGTNAKDIHKAMSLPSRGAWIEMTESVF